MMMIQPLSSFKLSWKQIAVSLLVAIYIATNFFRIGGDAFVISLNNFIVTPLALGVTFLALFLWRQIAIGSQNRLLWSGLTIGWAMWTVAELWWAIASLIGQEVPYPSWADFFWLVGYIPMYIALWARIRSLPKIVNPAQKIGIWATSLASLGLTIFFIFIPIIRESDPTAIIESALNVLYPLADIILLILVLQIFFSYQQGMYGQAWVWLTLGFISFALGDLGFAYANTANLYYPDQQVNLLSTFGVDIPYNMSYLFVLIGLVIMQSIQGSRHAFENVHTHLKLVPNTHLLVVTKGDDTVISISQNYSRIFPQDEVKGKTIPEVLGISPEDANQLLKDIKAKKIYKEHTFHTNSRLGQEQVLISGVSAINQEYEGVVILLRMLTKDYSVDKLLTDHEKAIASSLSSQTGTKQKEEEEIKQLLSNYYRTFLQTFYTRVFTEGGSIMADTFLIELQSVSRQHTWQIGVQPSNLLDVSALSLLETQKALPILFEAAKRFVAHIIDESNATMIVQDVRSKFDEATLRNISHFELEKQEHT